LTKLKDKNFKIFVDFDGTITKQDVGEELILQFGKADEAYNIIKLWMNDEISSKESWIRLCETVSGLNESNLDQFLSKMEIEESFIQFIDYCRKNNFEMKILSDGLSFYIDKILNRIDLNRIEVFSNIGIINDNGSLSASFPHGDEECLKCANCKRNHIINNSSDLDFTVYIGDGYSDKCPAQYCDYIFAKTSLLKYCEKNRITYFPFKNFNDVMKRLDELKQRNRLKKRHQAELKRREVYMQG